MRICLRAKRRPNWIACCNAIKAAASQSGTQLYDYLKAHRCVGLTAGRARVHSTQGQYVCIYDPQDNKAGIYPCAWTRRDMLSQ